MTRDSFRSEVPVDIKVPELNEPLSENQKKEIAVPEVVVPAAPGADTKLRSFNISAADNKFTPTKIIANLNDIVHISFTALDKDYSLYFPSYRMSQSAKQGETKILEFQASKSGDFLYYCPTCGGPENGPTGHIIIVE
jgi:heme/copper-type cytochrome/quinol oxidase subunit 2